MALPAEAGAETPGEACVMCMYVAVYVAVSSDATTITADLPQLLILTTFALPVVCLCCFGL